MQIIEIHDLDATKLNPSKAPSHSQDVITYNEKVTAPNRQQIPCLNPTTKTASQQSS